MLFDHAFLPHKVSCNGVDEAPSSAASTCASPVLSRQNSKESTASGYFFSQDVIKEEEPSAAMPAVESQAIRVPLAQKRFSIRMHGEEGALDSDTLDRPCVSPGNFAATRAEFMQKRFAIRMGDDEVAWLPSQSQQPKTTEQPQEAFITCQARVPLVQRRFAIRFRDDSRSISVRQPKEEPVSKCKVTDLRSIPASASTRCREDQAARNAASVPLVQKRFAIRMSQGSGFWDEEARQPEAEEQQHEHQPAPVTFSQRRFAIRMHDELCKETTDVLSEQAAPKQLDAQPAVQSFSQRLLAARQHEFEV